MSPAIKRGGTVDGVIRRARRMVRMAITQMGLRGFFGRRWGAAGAAKPAESAPMLSPRQRAFLVDEIVQPVRPRPAPAAARAPTAPAHPGLDPRPEVTIVLGSFNRRALLEQAISSVRANLAELRGEIIVVDGGSDDGSADWLLSQKDVITVVQHNRYEHDGEQRRRMSWGRFMNIAFRAAGANNVIMISDDCYLLPDAIPNALRRMHEAEEAGLRVGGCAFYFRDWPHDERYFVQRTLGGNLMINHGVYKRAALEQVGYANEDDFVFYKADSDLSLAIWAAGYAIIDGPQSICEHYMSNEERVRATNTATLKFDRRQLHRRWAQLTHADATDKMGRHYLEGVISDGTAERVFGAPPASPPKKAAAKGRSKRRKPKRGSSSPTTPSLA